MVFFVSFVVSYLVKKYLTNTISMFDVLVCVQKTASMPLTTITLIRWFKHDIIWKNHYVKSIQLYMFVQRDKNCTWIIWLYNGLCHEFVNSKDY